MTDTTMESGQGSGTANSAPTGDKPTSQLDEAKLLERIRSLVESTIEKKLQSQKDRRFDKIEKTLGDFQPVLEKVKDLLTPEQLEKVQRDLEWDEMKRRTGLSQTGQEQRGGSPQPAAVENSAVKALGLDENDPDVAAILREGGDTLRLAQVAIARASKPTPSPASAPAMGTPPPPSDKSPEQVMKEYQGELAKIPRGNILAVSELQSRYRKLGLRI